MDREAIIEKYKTLGLEVVEGFDQAGKVYERHCHETTYLWTVAGSITITKDGEEPQTYTAGNECVIADGQVHEAIVGSEGWQYIAGWDPEEAKKYPD